MFDPSVEVIEITIQSGLQTRILESPTLTLTAEHADTVQHLIETFCRESGFESCPEYYLRTSDGTKLGLHDTVQKCAIQSGAVLVLMSAADKDGSPMSFGCSQWWLLAGISLLLGGIGIAAISFVFVNNATTEFEYGIVFDAGSSHTHMYIYQWNGGKLNGTAVAKQIYKCKAKALSTFESHPYDAGTSLIPCLSNATSVIPADCQSDTRLYLGATAGMRLVHAARPNISGAIFDSIRYEIGKFPFYFTNASAQARIISGEEEGTFSWITANYLIGTFGVAPDPHAHPSTPNVNTYGALDMGGASTQITFQPESHTILLPEFAYDLSLYGTNYTLYTHSFLCYGINEAERRLQAQLVKDQNYSSTIQNPCGPKGNQTTLAYDIVFEAPCTKGPQALHAYGYEIVADGSVDALANFTFIGESDPDGCYDVTSKLFNFTSCNYTECSFNGQFQPPVHGQYFAISSYYYLMDFLNFTSESNFSLEEFERAATHLCNLTWNEVKNLPTDFPSGLPRFCFQSQFIQIILTEGFKFNSSNWESIQFVENVAGTDLGWALGFMLHSSNVIPEEYPEPAISLVTFVLLMILFVIFLVIAVAFACHAHRRRYHKARHLYEKLEV